jgi:predicted  nucleic acid-binding Zn-ribbon protein
MSIEEFESQDELDDAFDADTEWEMAHQRLLSAISAAERRVDIAEDELVEAEDELAEAENELASCEAEAARRQEILDDAKIELAELAQELDEHLDSKDSEYP